MPSQSPWLHKIRAAAILFCLTVIPWAAFSGGGSRASWSAAWARVRQITTRNEASGNGLATFDHQPSVETANLRRRLTGPSPATQPSRAFENRGAHLRRSGPAIPPANPQPTDPPREHQGLPSIAQIPLRSSRPPVESSDRLQRITAKLRELGASYYLLESWGKEVPTYRFYCQMESVEPARRKKSFEATETTPIRAMEVVLNDVVRWLREA